MNPEKQQLSNFKSTVLCVAREFASRTGTVGKPCVSSFGFCTRFLAGFVFWSPFSTKRVDFPRENAVVWVTQTANKVETQLHIGAIWLAGMGGT